MKRILIERKYSYNDENKICTACGTQFSLGSKVPNLCPICEDNRQYIPERGQTWTNKRDLSNNYEVLFKKVNDRLYQLKIIPAFAIGQRAFFVLAPSGNILWDCIPHISESAIDFIRAKGGLKAIIFSHPHFYSNMNEWADIFNCPIYIHQKDKKWIFNHGNHVVLWPGIEKELWDGIKIINIGGHFTGSSILHIPFLSPKALILCGDTLFISPNKRHIAVMYSYPNKIPLPLVEIKRIKKQMLLLQFDTLHGAFDFQDIFSNPKLLLETSLGKYK